MEGQSKNDTDTNQIGLNTTAVRVCYNNYNVFVLGSWRSMAGCCQCLEGSNWMLLMPKGLQMDGVISWWSLDDCWTTRHCTHYQPTRRVQYKSLLPLLCLTTGLLRHCTKMAQLEIASQQGGQQENMRRG